MQTRSQTRHLSQARTSTSPPRMQTRSQTRHLSQARISTSPPRGGVRISRVTELVVEQPEDNQIIIIEALNKLLCYVKPDHIVEWSGRFLELRRSTAVPQRNRGRTPRSRGRTPRNQEQIGVLTHEQNVPSQTGPQGGPDVAGFDHDSGYDGRDALRERREPELSREREDWGVETETEIPNFGAELEGDGGVQMTVTREQNSPPQTNMQTGPYSCVREQTETQEQNLLPETNMQTGPRGGPDVAGFDHDSGYDGRDVLRERREPELGGEREDGGVETETEIPNSRAELEGDEGVQMKAEIAGLRAQIAEAKQKFYDTHLVPYMASLEMLQVIVSKLPLSTTPMSFSEISQLFSKRIQGTKKYNFPASRIPEPNSVINSLVTKTWTSGLDIMVSVDQSENPQAVHVSKRELSETFGLGDLRKKLENAVKKHNTYLRKKRSSQKKEAHGDGDDGARDVDVGDVGDDDFGDVGDDDFGVD